MSSTASVLWFLAGIVLGVMIALLLLRGRMYSSVVKRANEIAISLFEQQRKQLEASIKGKYEAKLEEWKMKAEKEISERAIERSRLTLKGKIVEQIAPILPLFRYNPSDVRFIGSPVDYIVFTNYTEVRDGKTDKPIEIVFLEVKAGERADLSSIERKIKEAIEEKRVRWEVFHLPLE